MTYSDVVMGDNPVVYIPMQEKSGSTAYAGAGGVNGSIVGGVTLGAPGPFGDKAFTFDGTTGVIQFASWPTLQSAVASFPVVFEMLLKPTGSSAVGMFDTGPAVANVARIYPANTADWQGGGSLALPSFLAGDWVHLVLRYYTDATTRVIDSYVNGVWQATSSSVTPNGISQGTPRIGNINNGTNGWYAGSMAHFAVYSRINGNTGDLVTAGGGTSGQLAVVKNAVNRHYQAALRNGVSFHGGIGS